MRNTFKLGLLSLVLSLCAGAGVIALSARKEAPRVEAAAQSITFTKVREVFIELDDDPSYSYSTGSSTWSTSAFSGARHTMTVTNGTNASIQASLGETSSSKKWHATFVEYSYTFTNYAYSQTTLSFTYSLSTYRDQASGAADHVMEFIHEGYGSSTSNTYTLICSKDSAATTTTPNTSMLGNPVAYRVNSNTSGTTQVNNQSFTRTLTNTTQNNASYTFYVGFFAYIESSNYTHTHTANATLNLTVNTTNYDCSYQLAGGSTQYGAFTSAWNAVNGNTDGGSITLIRDVDVTSGFTASKNVTLNLNGYSITRNGSGEHANRYATVFSTTENSGKTLVISNNNKGTGGYISTNYATSTIWINAGSTVTLSDGATVRNTYGVSGGGHVVVNSGGTLNVLSSSLIGADTASSTTNTCVLLRNGAYFYASGAVIQGCTYSIRSDDTTNKDYVYLGGNCIIERKVGIPSTSALSLNLHYNNSTPYGNGSSVLQLEFSTLPSPNSAIASCVNATYGPGLWSKLSIIGAPDYMSISYINPNYYYVYRNYNFTFNLSHLTSSNSVSGTHNANWTTTLSPTDSSLYTLPTYIEVERGSTDLTLGTDYTYNSSTGVIVIYAEAFIGYSDFRIAAQAGLTTKGKAYQFIDSYMHMSDYTENLGYCKDLTHNYFGQAKIAFNNLDSTTRAWFMEKNDEKIANARARFIAWAAANGKEIVYETDDYIVRNNAVSVLPTVVNQNDYTLIIVIIVATTFAIACGAFVIIRKRRHQ